ncbi:PREDICTED: probable G-protein coupled receptor 25, partial [Chaetura pelagica]|uniref:probable G-protein coupled receptor 25 n=1 Tax=Chaetura pelagica TaxID=8897 RepID=UPI0005238DE0
MAPEELPGSADYDYPPVTNVTGNQELPSSWEVFFTTVFIPTLYSFIFLLGLVGNLFVIALMAQRSGGKRVVDTFVLNLAVADVIFVCTLPLWVLAGARGHRWVLGEGLCKLSSYIIAINRCSSILFLTALSVERYLVIRKVLDTKVTGPRWHVRVTCGVIWVVSLLLGAPSLVYRQLDGEDCWDEDGEDFSLAMVFLTFLLPLGIISFCYCSIYCRLQRHVRLGRGVRRSHRAIVTIVTAFLCSWLPLNACKVLLFFLAKGTLVLSQGQEVALSPTVFLYEQDLAPLRYQRLVASHSRIVRTPSLKDYPPGGRGLSKATVTEELKSWHQRARLRGTRPHSLDRQGAFRGPRGGTTRDLPIDRGVLPWAQ